MSRPLPTIAAVALAVAAFAPSTVHAQFRYLLGVDLRETYNSNVFAGVGEPSWDLVSEAEPSLRFYYNTPRSLLWMRYGFLFQFYARTDDPTAGRRLLGYANDLQLEYTHLFGPVTALRILDRFNQGTENTSVGARLSDAGQLSPGFLTTGSKFITDSLIFELQHLITSQWGVRPRVDGGFYYVYDRVAQPNLAAPPTTWTVEVSNRVEYAPSDANLFYLDLGFTTLNEQRDIYPMPLYTYFGEAALGWRHYWNDFWDTSLSLGIDYRSRQLYDETTQLTDYFGSWGPLGAAMIRYRYGRTLYVALEYSHRYEALIEFAESTSAEADEVGLAFDWILGDFRIEANAHFRYLRAATRRANVEEQEGTKIGRFDATLAYRILPGLSIEAGYQLELVRDQLPAASTAPSPVAAYQSYDRHQAMLGISVLWPPPPPQDVRLNRRESEYEPVFNLVGGDERRMGEQGASREEERARAADRERQRRRREGSYGNPFDTDDQGNSLEPPAGGTSVDAGRGESTSQSQSPERPR